MYAAIVIALVLGAAFWASYSIRSGVYVKAFCRTRTPDRVVALTFDDGPHPVQTPLVLDVLARHGVRAAFFVVGEKARAHPEVVRRMADEGHLVGNHTDSHLAWFPVMSASRMRGEMRACSDAIEEATGSKPVWFRPPFGVTNPTVARAVKAGGYRVAGWSIRSLDTAQSRPRQRVLDRVCRRLRPGAVVLLHDDRAQSDELLEMILGRLAKEGYWVERLDKMAGL